MILAVFVVLFLVAVALIIAGEFSDFTVSIVGLVILILVGAGLLGFYSSGLAYVTGQNVSYVYTYTNASNTSIASIAQTNVLTTANIETGLNRLLGWSLVIGGAVGLAGVFLDIKKYMRKGEEDDT